MPNCSKQEYKALTRALNAVSYELRLILLYKGKGFDETGYANRKARSDYICAELTT